MEIEHKQVFSAIVGNDALKSKLFEDITSNSLSHAYIIEGKKGSGKHTLAKMVAAACSCENSKDPALPLPCLTCDSCKKILSGNSPDVITVSREEDKATMGVDVIRFLRHDVRKVPNELEQKIYIIEDAQTMTTQAQNAFLLTLEEPPSFVKFFLLCDDSSSLLETIRSRAQTLRTAPVDEKSIDGYLQDNYDDAKRFKLSDPLLYAELLMASENSIGRAIELLDAKEFKLISENRALAKDLINILIKKYPSASSLITRFESKRDALLRQMLVIENALRDLIVCNRTENAPLTFFSDRDEALTLCDGANVRELIVAYDLLKEAEDAISANANVKLTLINFLSKNKIL